MTDLKHLLDGAVDTGPADPIPATLEGDLARGRRALRRRRARLAAGSLTATGAVGALVLAVSLTGGGVPQTLEPGGRPGAVASRPTAPTAQTAQTAQTAGLRLSPQGKAGFILGATPPGWVLLDANPWVAVLAREGAGAADPNDFRGKIVVQLDRGPVSGRSVQHGGRTFQVGEPTDGVMVSVATRSAEPEGFVVVQVPTDSGLTQAQVLDVAGQVRVTRDAQWSAG